MSEQTGAKMDAFMFRWAPKNDAFAFAADLADVIKSTVYDCHGLTAQSGSLELPSKPDLQTDSVVAITKSDENV